MRITLLLLTLVIAGSVQAEAQNPDEAFADLGMRLKSGDRVIVTDGGGRETSAVFAKVSDLTLSLLVEDQLRDIPSMEVGEIAKQGDSLRNGFLIGAGMGAVIIQGCDDASEACLHPAAAAVLGGVVFGGVGGLIDHFIRGRTVVFRVNSAVLRSRVKAGDTVSVTDGSGHQTTGAFAKVSDSTLSLLVGGQPRDIPFTDVREVTKQGDSVWNGFWIGAGIGAVVGALAGGALASEGWSAEAVPVFAAATALGGGGVGALVDHFIKGRTVVFRAKSTALRLHPSFSLARHGVSLSMALSTR
jgi:lipoprotein signal peptidase/ribosomal protein L24